MQKTDKNKSKINKLLDLYILGSYIFLFGIFVISFNFVFQNVTGNYLWFSLDNENKTLFYAGSLLILCSLFYSLIRFIGPIGYSRAEIFWKYNGMPSLPAQPWRLKTTWVLFLVWLLAVSFISTVLISISFILFVANILGSLWFGFIIIQGVSGAQILEKYWILDTWSFLTGILGLSISIICTTHAYSNFFQKISASCIIIIICAGIFLSVFLQINSRNKNLSEISAAKSYNQRIFAASILNNISSPDSFKYYGADNQFFRSRLVSAKPHTLSIAAALDSYFISILILAFSIPLGIFLSILFGVVGAATTTVVGSWIIAGFYRWLAREWNLHRSLRSWLGGSYIKQLIGYCCGSVLMIFIYSVAMTIIFGLPVHMIIIILTFGLTLTLGDANPPNHINYDLLITTIEGIVVPAEQVKAVLVSFILLTSHIIGIFLGPIPSIAIALFFLMFTLYNHWKNNI